MCLNISSPEALGLYLRNHWEVLTEVFRIQRPEGRTSRGKTWVFHFRDDSATESRES